MRAGTLRPLLTGAILALMIFGLFRLAGHLFLVEGRAAANAQAVCGALLGLGLGWLLCNQLRGVKGTTLAVIPGLLLMAAITSHFSLVFPDLDPKLDKGFGGLMLWFYGFVLVGGIASGRKNNITSEQDHDHHCLYRSRQHGRADGRQSCQAGHAVTGFDLSPASCAEATAAGVSIAPSAVAAVASADVIVTMLPAGKHVRGVWAEVAPHAKSGALIVDSSTIDVESARAVHALANAAGLKPVDAPVSGGTGGAKGATLTFMVGGEADAFAAARPILEQMGKKVVHCGGAGAGQAAKICNNMILGISMIGVGEAFALAEKLGLSHQALFDVASTSSGQCWSLTTYCPVPGPVPTSPANNGYKPGFAADLMLKDLKLAQEAASSAGAATPLGAAAAQLYTLFAASGHGGTDFSGIIEMLRGAKN